MSNKRTIGLTEKVVLYNNTKTKKRVVKAKVDTGATSNSIDSKVAAKLKLGPVIKTTVVKSANGKSLRPVIKAFVTIAGMPMTGIFTLADRNRMSYKVLIGQDILKKGGFLIDPKK